MNSSGPSTWQQAQQTLDILSALSYRTGDLDTYLHTIAVGVSQLLGIHWTVVTLCEAGLETVLASSIQMGDTRTFALHGRLVGTVIALGHALIVEDVHQHPEYGRAPTGYQSYLGIPLRTPQGQIIGTICSFHQQARHYSREEIQLVEMFAERAATVLDNYRLWQKERQFHMLLEAEIAQRTQELHNAHAELVERERLAAIGEFAAMIIHEIRSPLTTISGVLQRFKTLEIPMIFQEYLTLATHEAERQERLLREILLYAKPPLLQRTPLDLHGLIAMLLPQIRAMPSAQNRVITVTPPTTPAWVLGDVDKLKQVCFNIFANACEAVGAGEEVLCQITLAPPHVLLEVQNGGKVIDPEVLPQLTDPFYTTKPTGIGLGLALVKRIIVAHGGELRIRSAVGKGTTVTVALPFVQSMLPEHIADPTDSLD